MKKRKHVPAKQEAAEPQKPCIVINGHTLTEVEKELMPMLIKDFPRKMMAVLRKTSVNTINAQLRFLYSQLKVKSNIEAIKLALKSGYDWDGIFHPQE
jgi:DNA-binding NarL/FixJ family response regulator